VHICGSHHHALFHSLILHIMKKLTLLVTCGFGMLAYTHAAEVWAPGVSLTDGWYDFNKYSKGGTPSCEDSRMTDDGNMCWAASVANVIAWWQEQNNVTSHYSDMGRIIPQGKDVYQTYVGVFENVGGNPAPAFRWWVDGTAVPGTRTVYGDEGGPQWTGDDGAIYYPDFYYSGGLLTNTNYTPTPLYSFADNPVTIADTKLSTNGYNVTLQHAAIVEALTAGYALSLEVATNDTTVGEHAITLWGVEYTEATDGVITLTKAYMTDSDDYHEGIVTAQVDKKGFLYDMKIANAAYQITNVHGLRTVSIPEPTTATLSLLALGGLLARRRR